MKYIKVPLFGDFHFQWRQIVRAAVEPEVYDETVGLVLPAFEVAVDFFP